MSTLLDPIPSLTPEDKRALHRQLTAIERMLQNGEWHTLSDLARASGATEAGASARVRDCRKLGWNVERCKVGPRRYVYRINGRLPVGSRSSARASAADMRQELLDLRARVERLERGARHG